MGKKISKRRAQAWAWGLAWRAMVLKRDQRRTAISTFRAYEWARGR
jgi:hypothetical protein